MKRFSILFLVVLTFFLGGCIVVEDDYPEEAQTEVEVDVVTDDDVVTIVEDVAVVMDGENDDVTPDVVAVEDTEVVTDSADDDSDETPVESYVFDATELDVSLAEYIEDGANYTVITGMDEVSSLTGSFGCPEQMGFMDKVQNGDVARLSLFTSPNPWGTDLHVYVTPNYERWTTSEFREAISFCPDGAGVPAPLKAYADRLLWGYPNCSAGVAPPAEYEETFLRCVEVSEALQEYLRQGTDFYPPKDEAVEDVTYKIYNGTYVSFEVPAHWSIASMSENISSELPGGATLSVAQNEVMYGDFAWSQVDFRFFSEDVVTPELLHTKPLTNAAHWSKRRVGGKVAEVYHIPLPEGQSPNKGEPGGQAYYVAFPEEPSLKSLIIRKQAQGDAEFEEGFVRMMDTLEFKRL